MGRFETFLNERQYSHECSEISTAMVPEYLIGIQLRHKPHTISNSIRTLKALVNYGVKEELPDVDRPRRVLTLKIPQAEHVVHDLEEIDQLL